MSDEQEHEMICELSKDVKIIIKAKDEEEAKKKFAKTLEDIMDGKYK